MRGRGGTPTGESIGSAGVSPVVADNPYGQNEASVIRNKEMDTGAISGAGYAPFF